MKSCNVETFLRNAKRFIEYNEQGNFSHELDNLIVIAKEGKNPCDFCEKKKSCANMLCLPYYIHFRNIWRNIQRSAGNAKPGN